jgi:hypothetical protein
MIDAWHRISERERRLIIVTLAAVLAAVGLVIVRGTMMRVALLDEQIVMLENDVLYYAQLAARRARVEEAFAGIASVHSSAWTQEEIHDKLQQEIRRLSLEQVRPPDAVTDESATPERYLVHIRSLPPGQLQESGRGYREYRITFRTEPNSISNVVAFLQRLEESPQALRVDSLELTRGAETTQVAASVTVTRTIIDYTGAGAPEGSEGGQQEELSASPPPNLARNGNFQRWSSDPPDAPEWESAGLSLSLDLAHTTEGAHALRADAVEANAVLYQIQELNAGGTYDLHFDAAVTEGALAGIYDETAGEWLDSAQPMTAGGHVYRYHIRFTAPGVPGAPAALRAPYFVLDNPGATLILDRVILTEAGG